MATRRPAIASWRRSSGSWPSSQAGGSMPLDLQGYIDLPPHVGRGGFDHAAVHTAMGRCYVAHTANDALDVIDLVARKYVGSIAGLSAVAGALVTEGPDFVFTSNRGEDTIGIFTPPGAAV